jgi:formate hydrogenlyase subunit 6/NADH:ubiquinone oxidoreductase subunit I
MNRGVAGRLLGSPWFKNQVLERPILQAEKCGGCQKCKDICPAQAITMVGEKPAKPEIDLKKCIRCYCCAEICPDAAMHKSSTPWLGRVVSALGQ